LKKQIIQVKIYKVLALFLFVLLWGWSSPLSAQHLFPHLDSLSGMYGYKYSSNDSTWVIKPYNHDRAWAFSDQYARVKTNDGYNFLLMNAGYLSKRWFADAHDFKHKIAPVLHPEYNFVINRDSIRFKDSTICQETVTSTEIHKWNFIRANIQYRDSIIYKKVFKGLDSVFVKNDEETNLPVKVFTRLDSVFVADSAIVKIPIHGYEKLFENGFDAFHYIDKNYIVVHQQHTGLLNPAGKLLFPTIYNQILWADSSKIKHRFLVEHNGKWAIADTSGTLLTTFQYSTIVPSENAYFQVKDSTGTYFLKADLQPLFKQRYTQCLGYNQGYALVAKDSLWGIIDLTGKEIIAPIYQYIGWKQDSLKGKIFINNKVQTFKNGFWGMVSNKGKVILENKFNEILPASEGFIAANGIEIYGYHPDGVWGFFDLKGKSVVSLRYDQLVQSFSHGVAIVGYYMMQKIKPAELEIRVGLIDQSGRALTGFLYKQIIKITDQLFALQNNANQWGFCDAKGKIVHACTYDEYVVLNNNEIKVEKFGKWGVVEANGKVLYEPVYKTIVKNGTAWQVEKFNAYAIYRDSIGFAKHEFDYFKSAAPNMFIFGLNGYYGLIDTKGNVILKNAYTQIEPFQYGFSVVKINGKYGMINKAGKYILQPEYDYIEHDTLGFLRVKGKEIHDYGHVKVVVSEVPKWGIIDSLGHTILEIKHTNILKQKEGIFQVKRGNLWGYFNMMDDQIIPFQFTTTGPFRHGLAIVNKDGEEVLINKNGEVVNKTSYDSLGILGTHTILFLKDNHYGLIDEHGAQLLAPCYQAVKQVASTVLQFTEMDSIKTLVNFNGLAFWGGFTDSLAENWNEDMLLFHGDTAWQVFNKHGKQVLPLKPRYEKVEQYSNGYARMTYGGKLGFIDTNGKLRISNQYDEISHFHEEMCAFKLLGKWGYIDKAEHIWTQPYYEQALDFQGGLGAVYKNNKWGFVDKNGREVTKLLYSEIRYDGQGFYAVKRNDHWGMVNCSLGEFLFTKFEQVEMLGDSYVKIGAEGKFGAANLKGELIVPIQYDSIDYDEYNKTVIAILKPQ
jgi:hypothetical protein